MSISVGVTPCAGAPLGLPPWQTSVRSPNVELFASFALELAAAVEDVLPDDVAPSLRPHALTPSASTTATANHRENFITFAPLARFGPPTLLTNASAAWWRTCSGRHRSHARAANGRAPEHL